MSPPPSTKFGKYELLARIAAGGMAEIFRARFEPAPGVTKQVVIKKILPHYAENKAFIAMFTNEARIVMGLSHGNIAQVFDFGAIDGDWFLAMELVDGHPLSRVVRRAKTLGLPALPVEIAAFATAEVLKGLHYAHTRLDEAGRPLHIVHRDVSPQNVLISYEGQIKLVDFGIAKARNATGEQTSANAVKGKYAYFSPEQARARELDGRSDVFATGTMLYELLTGQLPFQGRLMDVLGRIVRGEFARPRAINPRIPPELERIVLKAMALEKADRYGTAEAFQQDLSRFLANHHPDAGPGTLALFMQLLYEEELVAEGRPVQLPREFLERSRAWKEPFPASAHLEAAEAPTEMVSTLGRPRFATAPRFEEVQGQRRGLGLGPLALVLAAAGVGYGAVTVVQGLRRATLDVTSVPPGAEVVLDGRRLAQRTPVTGLTFPSAHTARLELTAAGHLPWRNQVPIAAGRHVVVEAVLEREPPPPPPEPSPEPTPPAPPPAPAPVVEVPPAVEPGPEAPPAPPPVPDAVAWPVERFELDAARHRLDLSGAGATVMPLETGRTYRVALGGKALTSGWGFYVVSEGGAQPGTFGPEAMQIQSASKLYAFHVPASALGAPRPDDTKSRPLSLLAEGARRPLTRPVAPRLAFTAAQRVTVTGLSAGSAYALTPRLGTPPARVRASGPPVARALVGSAAGLAVATVDEATVIEGATTFWITLLDDATDDEAGRLTFELRELRSAKPRRPR